MTRVLLVGAGGFLGAIARYAIARGADRFLPASMIPIGTLLANVTGCLLVGYCCGISDRVPFMAGPGKFLIVTGFLGGLTTFSTFGDEVLALSTDGKLATAIGYVGLSLILGLGAVALGYRIAA